MRVEGQSRYRGWANDGAPIIPREVPDNFALDIETRINPERNTSLNGLYISGGNFCTQCEPEGFRRITYFLDRPDVMARYAVTIRADKARFPVLLSNGNPAGGGDLPDERRRTSRLIDAIKSAQAVGTARV